MATIGIAVVLVAGTVALVRLQGGAERVRVEPAASNTAPRGVRTKGRAAGTALMGCRPGSIVVAQAGLTYAEDYGIASAPVGARGRPLGEVDCYAPGSNGDTAPVESFRTALNGPATLAFDTSGDLWVGNDNNNTLVKYPQAQLDNANPAPSVVISPTGSPPSPDVPAGLAPDSSGDLWVVNWETNTVSMYTKDQLAESGRPVPHTVISYSGFYLPEYAVPDRSGDVWVAGGDSLVEFTKAALAKANPVPSVVISSSALGGQSSNTDGLGFDSQGDSWVSLRILGSVGRVHQGAAGPLGVALPSCHHLVNCGERSQWLGRGLLGERLGVQPADLERGRVLES